MVTRPLVLVASLGTLGALGGCIERIAVPQCTAGSFTQASVSEDTVTTTTGLRYIDGVAGAGAAVDWCRSVAITYDAFLVDGTNFDSVRDPEAALVFAPGFGDLIDGLEQGVIGMRAGGTRRLIISPALGFGPEPRRDVNGEIIVPGNSTVIFDIEIVQVMQ